MSMQSQVVSEKLNKKLGLTLQMFVLSHVMLKDFSYSRDTTSSGLRTVIKTVGLTGSRYFRELNSNEIFKTCQALAAH